MNYQIVWLFPSSLQVSGLGGVHMYRFGEINADRLPFATGGYCRGRVGAELVRALRVVRARSVTSESM
jgi:hypothetical protein